MQKGIPDTAECTTRHLEFVIPFHWKETAYILYSMLLIYYRLLSSEMRSVVNGMQRTSEIHVRNEET